MQNEVHDVLTLVYYFGDDEMLDDFSKGFEDILFKRFPEWKEFSRHEKSEKDKHEYLVVIVQAPTNKESAGLIILTQNEEITIGFDEYHTHEEVYESFESTYERAIEFIEELINERKIVLVECENGRIRQSSAIKYNSRIPQSNGDKKYYTRSWKGTYDQN